MHDLKMMHSDYHMMQSMTSRSNVFTVRILKLVRKRCEASAGGATKS